MNRIFKVTVMDASMGTPRAELITDGEFYNASNAMQYGGHYTLPSGAMGTVLKLELSLDVPADDPQGLLDNA